ncbi:hypothetical protein JAAARDRAFT_32924 [Jaapia argillacea MUCL 33604]|uniref:F-box domain-containing protein n=1 Tax=Jaapia argillacea MUCL 33604 TaxID=933084 RepID=A0A067Q0N8_9AGAM|nr:hypothetical protein JAAARDRAFT_32924 [Jaapia argillacea MUCL 33604]
MIYASEVLAFATSTLRELDFVFPDDETTSHRENLTMLLHTLPSRCPRLDTICIECLAPTLSLSFLGQFEHLRTIKIDIDQDELGITVIDPPAIRSLSKLQHLKLLRGAKLPTALDRALFQPGFPSLADLEVCNCDIRDVEVLLSIASSRTLRKFSMWFMDTGEPDAYIACLRTLSDIGESLLDLVLNFTFDPSDSHPTAIAHVILQGLPSLKLPNLETLQLHHSFDHNSSPIEISLNTASQMALAWPKIKDLVFEEALIAFSIESLAVFVSSCSNLVDLHLSNLIVGEIASAYSLDPTIICLGLQRLSIENPVQNVDDAELASLLDTIFPNLTLYNCHIGENQNVKHHLSELQRCRKEGTEALDVLERFSVDSTDSEIDAEG